MAPQTLAGHHGTTVTIDACERCQLFWFDARESLQLAPASTLRVFRLIGESRAASRQPLGARLPCPRCGLTLKLVHDVQRTTRFQYHKCLRDHGRLITFFDFLREKNFIRPMPPEQIEILRRSIASVNCSNCGAAIDLATASSCAHCGTPLTVLDTTQSERLVAELRAADRTGQPVDPALPMQLERARREVEAAFAAIPDQDDGVLATLRQLSRWLGTG